MSGFPKSYMLASGHTIRSGSAAAARRMSWLSASRLAVLSRPAVNCTNATRMGTVCPVGRMRDSTPWSKPRGPSGRRTTSSSWREVRPAASAASTRCCCRSPAARCSNAYSPPPQAAARSPSSVPSARCRAWPGRQVSPVRSVGYANAQSVPARSLRWPRGSPAVRLRWSSYSPPTCRWWTPMWWPGWSRRPGRATRTAWTALTARCWSTRTVGRNRWPRHTCGAHSTTPWRRSATLPTRRCGCCWRACGWRTSPIRPPRWTATPPTTLLSADRLARPAGHHDSQGR